VGFADRISLFASGAANLTVALLLVLAVILVAMAGHHDAAEVPARRWQALLSTATAIASIVVLANVAQAIVILSDTTGQFSVQDSANKAASILALLPPALGAGSAAAYALTRIRKSPEPLDPAND
jgi:hypothetical protein